MTGMSRRIITTITILAAAAPFAAAAGARYPVVIVPPLGGSRLTAVWDKPRVVETYCTRKQTEPFDLYISNEMIVPGVNKCWRDNFRNTYDMATATFQSMPGVVVTPVPGVEGVNCLTTVLGYCPPAAGDAHNLIDALEKQAGYTPGIDLFAATYDFRLIADDAHLAEYFAALRATIETAVAANGGRAAHVVCHSLGCPVAASFLNTAAGVDAAWKQRHVRTYFSLSGAYAGSPSALRSALSGDNEGTGVANSFFVPISARQGGTLWMFPDPSVLQYAGAPPVVRWTDTADGGGSVRNYTASVSDQAALLTRNGYADSAHAVQHVIARRWSEAYAAPNITSHLLYGSQLPTELWYEYKTSGGGPIAGDPTTAYCEDPSAPRGYRSCKGMKPSSLPSDGVGDGTVLYKSLHAVDKWADTQDAPVHKLSFPGVSHADMIKNAATVSYVVQHIISSNKGQPYDAERVTRNALANATSTTVLARH